MPHCILEKAGEQIADSFHEASRVTAAAANAIEDGLEVAKGAAKQSSDAAQNFVNESSWRIRRHPVATVAATLAAGFAIGILAGLARGRR